jgi:hypothetical protein
VTRKSLLNIPAMDLAGVITLSNFAYCIAYKEVGLTWMLENIAPAKDLAGATFIL